MKAMHLVKVVVCLLGSVACGSSDETAQLAGESPNGAGADEAQADQLDQGSAEPADGEFGTVEQAFGEGTCATGTVNKTIRPGTRLPISPPYNNASCSQSVLVGVQDTRVVTIIGTAVVSGSLAQKQADCALASIKVQYFSKGQLVASFNKTGGRLNNSCTLGPKFVFQSTATPPTTSGDTVTLGPVPVAADKARFAVQVFDKNGRQQSMEFET